MEFFAGKGKVGGIYANDPFNYTTYLNAEGFPLVENPVHYYGGAFIHDAFFKDDDLFYFATEQTRRDSTGRPLLDPFLYKLEKGASDAKKIKAIIGEDIMGRLPDGRFLFTGFSSILFRGTSDKTFLGVTDGTEDGTFFLKDFSIIDTYSSPAIGRFTAYDEGYVFCRSTSDAALVLVSQGSTTSINEINALKDGFYLKKVFPNPFSEQLTLEINSTKNELVNMQFYDAIGRLIYSQSQYFSTGLNQVEIEGKGISEGLIFIKVGNQVAKVIKR